MKDPTDAILAGGDTDLERTVRRFAAKLRSAYAEEIGKDPRKFKKRMVTLLRRSLPPFAGRPSEASITVAIKLRKEGRPWSEVYSRVIASHSSMDAAVRRQAESNLRAAARSRRNARRRRRRGQRFPLTASPQLSPQTG